MILVIAALIVGSSVLHALLAAWALRRGGRPWSPATRAWVVAALLFAPYCYVALRVGRHIGPGVTGIVAMVFGIPALGLSLLASGATRHWLPGAAMVIAGLVSGAAFVVFEKGTHGWWYVQNEVLAIVLSVIVGIVAWHVPADVGVVLWALSRRRPPRPGCCGRCGYSLEGLETAVCPECGASDPAGEGRP